MNEEDEKMKFGNFLNFKIMKLFNCRISYCYLFALFLSSNTQGLKPLRNLKLFFFLEMVDALKYSIVTFKKLLNSDTDKRIPIMTSVYKVNLKIIH